MSVLSHVEAKDDRDAAEAILLHVAHAPSALAAVACVNKFFASVVLGANHLWEAACDHTWNSKVHVVNEAQRLRSEGRRAREALRLSLEHARRTWLTEDELCGFEWSFRFKQQAGSHWLLTDPYYTHGRAALVRFLRAEDGEGGTVAVSNFELVGSFDLRWRWGPPTAGRTGPTGAFVQLEVNGTGVPTYVVSRHPTNWGFLMQSCWALYTSFPMPPRGEDPLLEDDNLEIDIEAQLREAQLFNNGGLSDDDDDEAEGDDDDDVSDDDNGPEGSDDEERGEEAEHVD